MSFILELKLVLSIIIYQYYLFSGTVSWPVREISIVVANERLSEMTTSNFATVNKEISTRNNKVLFLSV